MTQYTTYYGSPVGIIKIEADDKGVTSLNFVQTSGKSSPSLPKFMIECKNQLEEYFAGRRKKFDVKLSLSGTEFQKSVWQKLKRIPFGKTLSYGDIARQIDNPKSFRAVGLANNKNKIAIILPCHRVVGSDGSLTGYASGLWRKEWLLEHEKSHSFTPS